MSSTDCLREFKKKQLTAADEEILRALNTIVKYEEGIDHQRGLLDMWKPELKLHRIDSPQRNICKEEDPADQHLSDQEMKSSIDQNHLDPLQVKKEEEELYISQKGEQLVLKQETDSFMLTPTYEGNDHSEDQTLNVKHEESTQQKESEVKMPVISSVVGAADIDQLLLSSSSHVSVGHKRGETCGEDVDFEPQFQSHCGDNTGERPHVCEVCGKGFSKKWGLKVHIRTHTGEEPYSCEICGKHFRQSHHLKEHMRVHSGEKPHSCVDCGKRFRRGVELKAHMRIHTSEKPYSCKTCGKHFRQTNDLTKHMKVHTGEKPFSCKTCGKHFRLGHHLTIHMRIHTGEKSFCCESCGKCLRDTYQLKVHMRRVHADEEAQL